MPFCFCTYDSALYIIFILFSFLYCHNKCYVNGVAYIDNFMFCVQFFVDSTLIFKISLMFVWVGVNVDVLFFVLSSG